MLCFTLHDFHTIAVSKLSINKERSLFTLNFDTSVRYAEFFLCHLVNVLNLESFVIILVFMDVEYRNRFHLPRGSFYLSQYNEFRFISAYEVGHSTVLDIINPSGSSASNNVI